MRCEPQRPRRICYIGCHVCLRLVCLLQGLPLCPQVPHLVPKCPRATTSNTFVAKTSAPATSSHSSFDATACEVKSACGLTQTYIFALFLWERHDPTEIPLVTVQSALR